MIWYIEFNLVLKQNQKLSTETGYGNTAELMPQTGTNRRDQRPKVPIFRMWTQKPVLPMKNQILNCEEATEIDARLCVMGPTCTECYDLRREECDELVL